MKKNRIFLLLALCLLLSGCGIRQDHTAQDGDVASPATGGGDQLPAEVVYGNDDGFYLQNGQDSASRSPLVTEHFSGSLPWGEQELAVDFLWCVFREKIYVHQPDSAGTNIIVEPIQGCSSAVTVLVPDEDRMDLGRYALARLEDQTVEWLFPQQLQGLAIRQLEMAPDLSKAVFLSRIENENGFYEIPFYCDGQQLVNLAESCGVEINGDGAVGVRWDGENIRLSIADSWVNADAHADVYLYHSDSGVWEQTAQDVPLSGQN